MEKMLNSKISGFQAEKRIRIAALSFLIVGLLFVINICLYASANASDNSSSDCYVPVLDENADSVINESEEVTLHGKKITANKTEFSGKNLENIYLDNTCEFRKAESMCSESNDYTRYGDRILGFQNAANYDFSDGDGHYVIRNLRIDLDSEPNGYSYLNDPFINIHYQTSTPWWDFSEEFTFFWKIRYFDKDKGQWYAYNDYKTSFVDHSDQGGDWDTSNMQISKDIRDNILKCTGSENLATAIRDGQVTIWLSKFWADAA